MVSATIRARLASSPVQLNLWALVAAFSVYCSMYGFRKGFAAGSYEGELVGGLEFKTLLITSQLLGYCLSKFVGIKVVSEMPADKRALAIIATVGSSLIGLVLFALLPRPFSLVGLFLNGLPLGMVWGLVFSFLEGRRSSDWLGAGLCASFIVASGFVKTIGLTLLSWGLPEPWMPAATGLVFLPGLLLFTWMLAQTPQPTAEDVAARSRREPMSGAARMDFIRTNGMGLVPLILGYMLLTAYRDFRDNFAPELYRELGITDVAVLTWAEIPVAVGSLLALASLWLVTDSRRALAAIHMMMLTGGLIVGVSTLAWQVEILGPTSWMIAVGLGCYIAYVPVNCVLFDRMFAALGAVGTAAFLITFTDAFGYLGVVGVMFLKDFAQIQLSWLEFFSTLSYATAGGTVLAFAVAGVWFDRRAKHHFIEQAAPRSA